MNETKMIPQERHIRSRLIAALLIFLFTATFSFRAALACPAYPGVRTITDSAGNTLRIRAHGDEFFSYTTDTDGNLLYRSNDGSYYYIINNNGVFALGAPALGGTGLNAQTQQPVQLGEAVNINAAPQGFREKLEAFYAQRSRVTAPGLNGADDGTSALQGYTPSDGIDPLYGKWVAEGHGFAKPASPEKGGVCPLLVLKIEYADIKCLFTDAEWHERIFGDGGVTAYYNEVSNRRFTYVPARESCGTINDGVITVTLPIQMPLLTDRGSKHNYDRGARADLYTSSDGHKYAIYGTASLFAYGVEAALSHIDFSQYDQKNDDYFNGNSDGYISPTELAVLVVSAGFEASYDAAGAGDPAVWASSWFTNNWWKPNEDSDNIIGEEGGIRLGGVMLYKYTIIGENLSGPIGNGSRREYDYAQTPEWNRAHGYIPHQGAVGTVCHELGHDLGLQDLYDTGYPPVSDRTVGFLSLMAWGSWGSSYEEYIRSSGDPDPGSSPSHLDAYSKIRLGFYSAQTASSPGVYPMTEAASPAAYNILRINTDNPDVYYLLENRTFTGLAEGRPLTSFDAGMFFGLGAPGGVVYWRIDEAVIRQKYIDNTVNNEPGHYGIMPEYVYYENDVYEPFRNRYTYVSFPSKRVFTLPERSSLSLFCNDATASTMNVWLRAPSTEPSAPSAPSDNSNNAYSGAVAVNARGELVCTVQTDYTKLVGVTTDGVQLTEGKDYTVSQDGDAGLTFLPAFLAGLADGTHTLRVQLRDGWYECTFVTPLKTAITATSVASVPATGGAPMWMLPFAIFTLLGAVMGIIRPAAALRSSYFFRRNAITLNNDT